MSISLGDRSIDLSLALPIDSYAASIMNKQMLFESTKSFLRDDCSINQIFAKQFNSFIYSTDFIVNDAQNVQSLERISHA